MSDSDKKALLDGSATIQTEIEIIVEDDDNIILTEDDAVVEWNYEDFRYVKDQGFLGQFIARQVTGELKNLGDDFNITDKEFILKLGVKINNDITWYSLGNFLVTKITDDEVNDKTSFEALDYTKKFNKAYEDTITYPCTALELAQNVCEQCGVELATTEFINYDYVITGNAFQNNESCRDVMKAIGKLAFSWVRIDWDNKLYIDFTQPIAIDEYDKADNSKYYNLTTQKEVFGPVNRVIIGYSQIEGERTKIEDTESIETNGVCELTIYDNPLVYTQAQRESIIESASGLLGLTYTPLNMLTVGHPWLKGDELFEVTDMEGRTHNTIPFDRTIQYFGHIKTLIDVAAQTKTNTELAYDSNISKRVANTEIEVDKINNTIEEIIEEQDETTSRLNQTISTLDGTVQRVSRTETTINDIVTTIQTSSGTNTLEVEDATTGNAISYSVEGKCEQDTYEGKNLLNYKNFLQGTWTGSSNTTRIVIDTGIFEEGETITFSNYSGYRYQFIIASGEAQTSGISLLYNTDYLTDEIYTLEIPVTGHLCIQVTNVDSSTNLSPSDILSTDFQLEKGSVATDYEQYVGGVPSPNPKYPQEIKTIPSIVNHFTLGEETNYSLGVNVTYDDSEVTLNGTTTSSGRLFTKNDNVSLGYDVRRIGTFPKGTYNITGLLKSGTITLNSGAYQILIRKSDSTQITRFSTSQININRVFTLTEETTLYIELYCNSSGIVFDNVVIDFQLEKGEIAHDYIPYGAYARVKITGKNLFDKDNYYILESANIESDGTIVTNSINRFKLLYYPLKKGTYTISQDFDWTFVISASTEPLAIGLQCQPRIINTGTNYTYTMPFDGYIIFRVGGTLDTENYTVEQVVERLMIETTDIATMLYEEYKENEVLVSLNKENIFSADNFLQGTALDNTNKNWLCKCLGSIKSGESYTCINNQNDYPFTFAISNYDTQNTNATVTDDTGTISSKEYTYTPTTDGYLWIHIKKKDGATSITPEEVKDTFFTIYEGNNSTPYYELCSIGNTKDIFTITNGQASIEKKIGKVILNGSENWTYSSSSAWMFRYTPSNAAVLTPDIHTAPILLTDSYITKAWDNTTKAGDYAVSCYNNGKAICIRNTDYSSLDDFKASLSSNNVIAYYLIETQSIPLQNANIPLFEGINHVTLLDDLETNTSITYYRNTPLSGTYATQTQLNEVSTEKTQEITQVREEVMTTISATEARIDVIREEIDESGVPIVNTGTGYTFDIEGLKIEKSNEDVNSQLDNDGLSVKYKDTEILSARSDGVTAENVTVNTFYIQKPIRVEKTKAISDSSKTGLGFFWIGE